jgi:hypothetical protein
VDAHINLGSHLAEEGLLAEAWEHYERVLAVRPHEHGLLIRNLTGLPAIPRSLPALLADRRDFERRIDEALSSQVSSTRGALSIPIEKIVNAIERTHFYVQ